MEIFAEPILSVALDRLTGKLTPGDFLKFVRKDQVDVELHKWKSKLSKIKAVLSDAEEKQMTSPPVKIWLSDLRDLAYDVEDILDEIETEALASNSREDSPASTSTIRKLLPSCCTGLNPTAIISNVKAGSKLAEITCRLQKLDAEKDELKLVPNVVGESERVNERLTTSLVEPHVYGREKDKEAILELMRSGETSDAQFSVIPIIGVGGLGKTTLAQLIYNDVGVKFDLKAWVCVSDDFDVCKITKTILQHWASCAASDLNILQEQLKEKLSGQKILIVLDDVWNENYSKWRTLCLPFVAGAPGSRIIVTTRSKTVTSTMSSIPGYELRELSHNDCLSVFTRHALDAENFDAHSDLKDIGERIVQRCKGLPLAAKALGGLLRGKQGRKHWEDLLSSKIRDLPEDRCGILPVLRLSYHYLPSYLKQCFVYCAIFPKDYKFDKSELVLLWMAEGFLRQHKKDKLMEDLGNEYFDELLSRSFFQVSSEDKSRYVMHDMINDLTQSINKEVCFSLVDLFEDVESFEKVRHSSFTPQHFDVSQRFDGFHKMKNLRTFLALPISVSWGTNQYLSCKVLHDLLPTLRRLRSLSLAGYHLEELPSSIADLKHLRYLNLSRNDFQKLPESLSKLFNLQTLILFNCKKLIMLPACIGRLNNLQHLDIRETDSLKEMPPQMGNLTNLHSLSKFTVGQGTGLRIRELMEFRHLRGKLHIIGLQNVCNVQDAVLADLKGKQGLEELTLQWFDDFQCLRDESKELHVLQALRPQQNLKKLSIISYGGTSFPSWLRDAAFVNVVILQLHNCRRSTLLPSLGQLPSLKDLSICSIHGVKDVGVEFHGDGSSSGVAFPSLENLLIDNMLEWEKWSWSNGEDEGAVYRFPKLQELTIRHCPKLVGRLPRCLSSLKKLSILDCPLLTDIPEILPSLWELNVEECQKVILHGVAGLRSLKILSLARIQGLASLNVGFIPALGALEDLTIESCRELTCLWQDGSDVDNLSSLKCLVIGYCEQLVSLVEGEEERLPRNLEKLDIRRCDKLEKLPNGLHSHTCLRELRIEECRKLACFPEGAGLPYSLKLLYIGECHSLESLPEGMMMDHHSNSNGCLLEKLEIRGCPSLKSFPKGKLPTKLKKLAIRRCENIKHLPEGIVCDGEDDDVNSNRSSSSNKSDLILEELTITCGKMQSLRFGTLSNLKKLCIWGCRDLEFLPDRGFDNLRSLKTFIIESCEKLRCLPNGMNTLTSLRELHISFCGELESFLERGFDNLRSLETLWVAGCEKLRCLPGNMITLTSLRDLRISGCWGLVSFPEQGFPPNLITLDISECENVAQPMTDWGLHKLTSLQELAIRDRSPSTNMMDSFPPPPPPHDVDGLYLLPTSLVELSIGSFVNLESISSSLQRLTSLHKLFISGCYRLRFFPGGLPSHSWKPKDR